MGFKDDDGEPRSPAGVEVVNAAFRQHNKMLLRWLTQKFGDSELARDIAQSTYLRVLRYAQHNVIDNPQALIFKTAANLAANEFRARKLRRAVHLDAAGPRDLNAIEQIASFSPSPEAATITKQEIAASLAALNGLPDRARRAFVLSRFENKTYGEIAKDLSVSESSVEKYIIAALKVLRKVIDEKKKPTRITRLPNKRSSRQRGLVTENE